MLSNQLWEIVGDRYVQPVYGASPKVCACRRKLLEIVQRIQPEEVPVDLRIWQVVTGNIRQRGETFVYVIVLGMFYNFLCNLFAVAKYRLVVVVGCKIAVYHFGVIPYTYLKIKRFYNISLKSHNYIYKSSKNIYRTI